VFIWQIDLISRNGSEPMIYRIEIGLKEGVPDARGRRVISRAQSALDLQLEACRTRDVYKVNAAGDAALGEAIREAFTDPVTSESAMNRLTPPPEFDWLLEVGFKPGVTDNVGRTARCVLQDVAER
jgi:phosphoribosylformylglycinamidine synthase